MYTYTSVDVHTLDISCVYLPRYIYIHLYTLAYMSIYIYIYTHIYMYIYLYVCIYTYLVLSKNPVKVFVRC